MGAPHLFTLTLGLYEVVFLASQCGVSWKIRKKKGPPKLEKPKRRQSLVASPSRVPVAALDSSGLVSRFKPSDRRIPLRHAIRSTHFPNSRSSISSPSHCPLVKLMRRAACDFFRKPLLLGWH